MYVLASGTFTERDKLAPLLTDEIAKVRQLRDRGIIPRPYRRADGSGVELLLDVSSVEDAREQLSSCLSRKLDSSVLTSRSSSSSRTRRSRRSHWSQAPRRYWRPPGETRFRQS